MLLSGNNVTQTSGEDAAFSVLHVVLDACSNIGRSAFLKSFYFYLLKENFYGSTQQPEQNPPEETSLGPLIVSNSS